MKKLLLCLVIAASLTACQKSKEQLGLKEALVAKLQNDSDLKDYKIDPADMAECVYKEIAEGAPGMPGDPRRARYFEAYTKFVAVGSPGDADRAIKEYQDVFGDVKSATNAAMTVTDVIMTCMGTAIDARRPE
ncbi:MAG: hypothetical protein FIA97_16875, partial [Methylococcaceae bacterium]|nr:hypothetical protein [Methylococcaceae bacterium]